MSNNDIPDAETDPAGWVQYQDEHKYPWAISTRRRREKVAEMMKPIKP